MASKQVVLQMLLASGCPAGFCQRLRLHGSMKGLGLAVVAQIGAAIAASDTSEAERHMGVWLSSVASWLHSAAAAPHEAAPGRCGRALGLHICHLAGLSPHNLPACL